MRQRIIGLLIILSGLLYAAGHYFPAHETEVHAERLPNSEMLNPLEHWQEDRTKARQQIKDLLKNHAFDFPELDKFRQCIEECCRLRNENAFEAADTAYHKLDDSFQITYRELYLKIHNDLKSLKNAEPEPVKKSKTLKPDESVGVKKTAGAVSKRQPEKVEKTPVKTNANISAEPSGVSETEIVENTKAEQETVSPNTLEVNGRLIQLIDMQGASEAPYGELAAFWQGTGLTTDGLTTHIMGHNPGVFSCLLNVQIGTILSLTDGNGHRADYMVYDIMEVNDEAYDRQGVEQWDSILNQPGEAISLQTCLDEQWNLMILARAN